MILQEKREKKVDINLPAGEGENQILYLAVSVGKILIESGAETYRVEDIIKRITSNFGLESSPFAIPTCIMCSARNKKGEIFSLIERVSNRTTDLDKVNKINNLVRHIGEYSYDEFKAELEKIKKGEYYSEIKKLVAYFGGAAFFSVLFKGGLPEFFASGIAGIFLFFWIKFANFLNINQYFNLVIGGSVCSMVAYTLSKFGLIAEVPITIISSYMIMVPGISFTNAIRDLIAGDFVSGLSRGAEAILIGATLAVGSGFTIYILIEFGGV
ncbi:MAG: threonine/serine ThrE exporter family protein [Fusobacteriaceae bacterium]